MEFHCCQRRCWLWARTRRKWRSPLLDWVTRATICARCRTRLALPRSQLHSMSECLHKSSNDPRPKSSRRATPSHYGESIIFFCKILVIDLYSRKGRRRKCIILNMFKCLGKYVCGFSPRYRFEFKIAVLRKVCWLWNSSSWFSVYESIRWLSSHQIRTIKWFRFR